MLKERPAKNPFLSKSKYLVGLQCLKLLWYNYNAKDKLPSIDAKTQAIFDQGHEVGKLVQTLFPDGISAGEEADFKTVIDRTASLLSKRKPIFEAGFLYKNTYARADILNPVKGGKWDIIEVKSSASIKDVNYYDVAFQRYCFEGAGIDISRCYLMYINNQYVRKGDIDPSQLFIKEDITDELEKYSRDIDGRLKKMCEVIASRKCPEIKIGLHCSDPYGCVLESECWKFLPDDNIFTLYRLKETDAFKLLDKGVLKISDIPDNVKLNANQIIQLECVRSGKAHINKAGIKDFLSQLQFPLYFLDFETFMSAIPPYDNSRPFRNIPFQFSLHRLEKLDSNPLHHAYLADGSKDPRPEILSRLKELLGKEGTIIAYNMSFEIARLKECAEAFPKYQKWVDRLIPRFTDLLTPFRSFDYYHPSQKGSAGIKKLAPPLVGTSYDDMDIGEGGLASSEYVRVTFGKVLGSEKQRVYEALLKYCELDTQVMIDIVRALKKIVS